MFDRLSGRVRVLAACAAHAVVAAAQAGGAEFLLPENGDNVVGTVTTAIAQHEDTLLDIGRRFGVGYEEIIAANPGVDPWLPGEGTEILIPSRFILPDAPREFEGGYTDIFITGLARNVHHCDVRSLYPSIIPSTGVPV